jgi:hypothetical protein
MTHQLPCTEPEYIVTLPSWQLGTQESICVTPLQTQFFELNLDTSFLDSDLSSSHLS